MPAITKTFGAARHHTLNNVNRELALWMGAGSVPAAFLGVYSLYHWFGGNVNSWLPDVIGYTLVLVGIAVAIRTFVIDPRPVGREQAAQGRPAEPQPQDPGGLRSASSSASSWA